MTEWRILTPEEVAEQDRLNELYMPDELRNPCPYCHAARGDQCVTRATEDREWRWTNTHKKRLALMHSSTTYDEVADVLKALPYTVMTKRVELKMSVREAAKKMGVARNTLTRFEDGEDVSIRFLPPILSWLDGGAPPRRPRLET